MNADHGADPDPASPGDGAGDDGIARQLARLTGDLDRRSRRRALRDTGTAMASGARQAGGRAVTSGRWFVDLLIRTAPLVPVRSLPELHDAYGVLPPAELADALIASASRRAAGIGAAAGALATVEWVAPPTLLTAPVQIAVEALAVVLVEVRLIAELHVVHNVVVPGTATARAGAYLTTWAGGRGLDTDRLTGSLLTSGWTGVLGQATRRRLRDRLLKTMARNTSSMAPFLTGAVIGAELNRRSTRSLGQAISADLAR